ncbi:hypothetical protein [Sphingobacterium pedocola]|nr:hypothetical protein [Sphingobacterium pedocola]
MEEFFNKYIAKKFRKRGGIRDGVLLPERAVAQGTLKPSAVPQSGAKWE